MNMHLGLIDLQCIYMSILLFVGKSTNSVANFYISYTHILLLLAFRTSFQRGIDNHLSSKLFISEIIRFIYPGELKMLCDLFGESVLKGNRLRPKKHMNPARLGISNNVNYITPSHTSHEEDAFYNSSVKTKFDNRITSRGYDFMMDVNGNLRIRSRYDQVRTLFFIICYYVIFESNYVH